MLFYARDYGHFKDLPERLWGEFRDLVETAAKNEEVKAAERSEVWRKNNPDKYAAQQATQLKRKGMNGGFGAHLKDSYGLSGASQTN
jgi:hypothetical protein